MPAAPDVPTLLRDLLAAPGRPRLTWYGPGPERIELSGKVLDNWVAKTANLLVDELDAGPGTVVGLDLPAHWRTVIWCLATWSAGAHAAVRAAGAAGAAGAVGLGPGRVDVLVTTDPGTAPAGGVTVAVALPALATSFGPGLPGEVVDAATQVRLQPDAFTPLSRPSPADPAFTAGGTTVSHGDLLAVARDGATRAGIAPGDRVLTGAGPDAALSAWLGPLAMDGSLVLHHDAARLEPAAREALRAQEGVTAQVESRQL